MATGHFQRPLAIATKVACITLHWARNSLPWVDFGPAARQCTTVLSRRHAHQPELMAHGTA